MIYLFKHSKLIAVLSGVALFVVLVWLVMTVTSCAPAPIQQTQVAATTRAQADATTKAIDARVPLQDGTLYHPYHVDPCPCGTPVDTWDVLTVHGREKWKLSWLYGPYGEPGFTFHAGDYILYQGQEYQISSIDRKHLTMGAVIVGN